MECTDNFDLGMMMSDCDWINLNTNLVFSSPEFRKYVAPFPPIDSMRNVSGLTSERDFAAHGATFYQALHDASPVSLKSYSAILDFGCGCGRLARMFKGHPGTVTGCDIDPSHVAWINTNLPYMSAQLTEPNRALPFIDGQFDCVISISVFTHMDEESQFFYLNELARCTRSGAYLFLTTHGERALLRARSEAHIFEMLEIPENLLMRAAKSMAAGKHSFILQNGHLTNEKYRYGITFIPSNYIRSEWGRYFDIEGIVSGAIHDFQDIIVCKRT
jgi:SAM-dependent methyltransferase